MRSAGNVAGIGDGDEKEYRILVGKLLKKEST
jgi:hypothetical protein